MNKVALISFIVLYLHAPELSAFDEHDLDATDLYCLAKLKYDKKDILAFFDEHDFITEDNEKMNTFYACAWKKDNLQNDDGSINVDNLKKMVSLKLAKLFPDNLTLRNTLANDSVTACKAVKGDSNGDTGIKIYNCILKKIAELTAAN